MNIRLHVVVVVTFLLLAATGLPIKFHWMPWAQSLILANRGWIEARWDTPLLVERVDVEVGDPARWPQRLLLLGAESGRPERLEAPRLRPRFGQLRGQPHGQVFILTPPRRLGSLRLLRKEGGAWSVAEIRVHLVAEPARKRGGS